MPKPEPGTFIRRLYPDARKLALSKAAWLRAMRKARDAEGPTVNRTKPVYRRDEQAR